MGSTEEVLAAAAALMSAFGQHDAHAYFDCFDEDATFLFHTTDRLLTSRQAYREEWAAWERDDGFRVLWSHSSPQHVQVLGAVAVFVHHVHTGVSVAGEDVELRERESIVFRRDEAGRWRGVHEHLSLDPSA